MPHALSRSRAFSFKALCSTWASKKLDLGGGAARGSPQPQPPHLGATGHLHLAGVCRAPRGLTTTGGVARDLRHPKGGEPRT